MLFRAVSIVVALVLTLTVAPQAVAAPGDVSDPNIVYVGRWSNTAAEAVPNRPASDVHEAGRVRR
jgi:hypothetical protein